jgi:plasmid stabilization system protein ParE
MSSYRISAEAQGDLEEIHRFIAVHKNNLRGADVVADYLYDAFEKIGKNPSGCGGKPKPHLTTRNLKFLTVKKYVVIYDDRGKPVNIIAVIGGRRDVERILFEDGRYRKIH